MLKHVLGLTLGASLLCGFKFGTEEKDYAPFRPHMQAIYSSMMKIFPLAWSRSAFLDKNNATVIQDNLTQIVEHATAVEKLASKDEKGHAALSFQLERNAKQAALKFKEGYPEQAQFFVEEIYDTCLSCHTSRTANNDSKYTVDFTKDIKMEALGTFGQVKFLSLSRQFEKALDEYERLFASSELSLEELLHFDPFVDYLILAIRVKGEPDRVIRTLSALVKKPLPVMIKRDLELWLEALQSIKGPRKNQSALAYAKTLLDQAKQKSEYPRDRSGLVYYIFASKYLKDSLNDSKLSSQQRAESYYLLGISELGIGERFLATDSGIYLEESIRLAPKAAFAKKAFGLYEQTLLFGYSGSSGVHLPAAEKAKLDELRKLVF